MSTLLIVVLFVFNMLLAFSIKMAVNDKTRKEYLSSKWVRWILLIPPVSIILAFVMIVLGILYTIYMALDLYLSND
jgi:formate-dependent nitrite reductase membrane component NrfD